MDLGINPPQHEVIDACNDGSKFQLYVGVCVDSNVYILNRYCSKRVLQDCPTNSRAGKVYQCCQECSYESGVHSAPYSCYEGS
jgi:hypothetical protein